MTFSLKKFGSSVFLEARQSHLAIFCERKIEWSQPESWPDDAVEHSAARRTSYEIASLLEMGFASVDDSVVLIPYENFADIEREEFRIGTAFTQASPFLLRIDRTGDLGRPGFKYKYQFLLAGQSVPLQRAGYYVSRVSTGAIYHLDASHYALLEAMDRFNDLPEKEKKPQTSWLTFAEVKRLSGEVHATLEQWLRSNDVIVPSSIGLDLVEDDEGALSFMPTCPELENASFRTVFDRNNAIEGFYSIDKLGQNRVRVVLQERQRAVLERMKRVRHVTGDLKQALIEEPAIAFDGIAGDVDLPPSYSDRVTGIGEFKFASVPKLNTDEPRMGDLWGASEGSAAEKGKSTEPEADSGREGKKTLLIDTHEESVREAYLNQSEHARLGSDVLSFQAPRALRPEFQLKKHQEKGVEWLQTCSQVPDRAGVLLADDMGLGKTLQILTFLAWCIESGKYSELSSPTPPFRPILITAPLILLETETWEKEMKRFFTEDGNVFWPVLPLYGEMLRSFRRKDLPGSEGLLGRPILDLDRIRKHRVVITNYEALRDYEFSFAYHPEGKPLWTIVVSDEAQEFKTPNSKISHAVKKLQPQFRVACTGTPVENRLLDLWNIFDTVQPGLLGSAREFTSNFEAEGSAQTSLSGLKGRLLYQKPHAFLLRRDKNEVLELPLKHEHKLDCVLSPDEVAMHRKLAQNIGALGLQKGRLALLHQFARLSQHPSLLQDSGDEVSVAELKNSSSKLRRVILELHKIRSKGEKAIIFARHKDVQRMLARVLTQEFHKPVRILNGETPRSSSRKEGKESRSQILKDFSQTIGFDVIVLSPFVAGVGLTIVEANHVFHYGRWWNPAVEAQATDRTYRLGQNKEVHVYLPILRDETGGVTKTFDQLLDELMERKKGLANLVLEKDAFLTPQQTEDDAAMEVFSELAHSASNQRG